MEMDVWTAQVALLLLLVAAVSGLVLARRRPGTATWALRPFCIALLVLAVLGLLSTCVLVIWDGGYPDAEFQLTFQDPAGKPVPGVELRVEDMGGRNFFGFPVTDYLPDQTPTSDDSGRMVFHHAGIGVEFSGSSWDFLFLIPVEQRRGPRFLCRFLHQGKAVYRIGFSELDDWPGTWEEVRKVKRRWRWPDWPASELRRPPKEGVEEDHVVRARRCFDTGCRVKLDPEEAAACHATVRWESERPAGDGSRGADDGVEMDFPVVQRVITVRP